MLSVVELMATMAERVTTHVGPLVMKVTYVSTAQLSSLYCCHPDPSESKNLKINCARIAMAWTSYLTA